MRKLTRKIDKIIQIFQLDGIPYGWKAYGLSEKGNLYGLKAINRGEKWDLITKSPEIVTKAKGD